MTAEIIILVAVAGILIILIRRLPDTAKDSSQETNDFWQANQKSNDLIDNFGKAEELFAQGDYRGAEPYYVRAVTRDPENPKIYNRLGVIYLEMRNYNDAREAFETALKISPNVPARHINLGIALLRLGKHKEAAKHFEKAVKLEPKNEKYRAFLKNAKEKSRSQ